MVRPENKTCLIGNGRLIAPRGRACPVRPSDAGTACPGERRADCCAMSRPVNQAILNNGAHILTVRAKNTLALDAADHCARAAVDKLPAHLQRLTILRKQIHLSSRSPVTSHNSAESNARSTSQPATTLPIKHHPGGCHSGTRGIVRGRSFASKVANSWVGECPFSSRDDTGPTPDKSSESRSDVPVPRRGSNAGFDYCLSCYGKARPPEGGRAAGYSPQ